MFKQGIDLLKLVGRAFRENPKEAFYRYGIPIIGFLFLLFTAAYFLMQPSKPVHTPAFDPSQSPYPQRIAGLGVIEPRSETVTLEFEVAGVVRDVLVKTGQQVKKDAPLVTLDTSVPQAQTNVSKALFESSQSRWNRYARLKDSAAVSEEERSQEYHNYLAKKADYELQQALLEKHTLKAPFDGAVLRVDFRPGDTVVPGMHSGQVYFGDTTTYRVRTEFDETQLSYFDPTSPAKAFLRGNGNKAYDLKFVRREDVVLAKKQLSALGTEKVDTRTFQVIYEIQNPDETLLSGAQMDVYVKRNP